MGDRGGHQCFTGECTRTGWFFWILLIVLFFLFLTPVPRRDVARLRQTPLEILQRRYAAGEISTAEYEERKARLEGGTPPHS